MSRPAVASSTLGGEIVTALALAFSSSDFFCLSSSAFFSSARSFFLSSHFFFSIATCCCSLSTALSFLFLRAVREQVFSFGAFGMMGVGVCFFVAKEPCKPVYFFVTQEPCKPERW